MPRSSAKNQHPLSSMHVSTKNEIIRSDASSTDIDDHFILKRFTSREVKSFPEESVAFIPVGRHDSIALVRDEIKKIK